jgi:glycosyltransferase involved in cell wall biosynthesis
MKLTVVIPTYNEEKTIEEVLKAVSETEVGDLGLTKEIIVVDDGSSDGTGQIVEKWQDKIILLRHKTNQGKGASIKTALKAASGDIIIIQDADHEYNPREYPRLLEPILKRKADVVYGSRFISSEARRVFFFWHYLGNISITFFCNLLANLNLSDVETGFKAFRKEALNQIELHEKDFGFEVEVTLKLAKKRCRFYETGISYYGRDYTEGKKIRWTDGIKALLLILRYGLRF